MYSHWGDSTLHLADTLGHKGHARAPDREMNTAIPSSAIPRFLVGVSKRTPHDHGRAWPHPLVLAVAILLLIRPTPSRGADWQSLFDGKTLKGWKITDFAGGGEVKIENGQLRLHSGVMLTGVSYTNELPRADYEVSLEAMKVDGSDFFCGLTFPVENSFCSFIVGGWGGGVVGLSSIDGMDASENETTKYLKFDPGRWYPIRVRVTSKKIEAWIDNEKLVDQDITDRKISLRPGDIEYSKPFGIATWQTTGALRDIKIRRLAGNGAEASPAPLNALFLTGGGYHDYKKLAPHLTASLAKLAN